MLLHPPLGQLARTVLGGRAWGGARGTALVEAWEQRDRNVIFAKAICVGVAFAAYHLFVATDGRLGEGTLWRAIWGKR